MAQKVDHTGSTFGNLRAVSPAPPRRGVTQSKTRWNVECICGEIFPVDTSDLTRRDGRARVSCGCLSYLRGAESPHWRGEGVSQTYYSSIRRGAIARGITFDLTLSDMHQVYQDQGGICALTGRVIPLGEGASLDRVNSSLGYLPGNIQWVHATVNRIKSNLPQDEFIQICKEVAHYERKN